MPAPATVTHSSPSRQGEGASLEAQGKYGEALQTYMATMTASGVSPADLAVAEEGAGRVNVLLVTTPALVPDKVEYVVQSGDSVDKIAKKFGTTAELVQRSNLIANSNLIKAGDRLRVLKASFTIHVRKDKKDMLVCMNDRFFKRYRIGTGKFGKTPVGTFKVSDRIREPTWWRPDGRQIPYGDPENELGTRWLALKSTGTTPDIKGYGIHGTWQDQTIGQAESAGCVRLLNRDVEELFDLIPLGTPVTIEE
jgi:lipoprotein-anchoring transpeptidase ErfK/SrfK